MSKNDKYTRHFYNGVEQVMHYTDGVLDWERAVPKITAKGSSVQLSNSRCADDNFSQSDVLQSVRVYGNLTEEAPEGWSDGMSRLDHPFSLICNKGKLSYSEESGVYADGVHTVTVSDGTSATSEIDVVPLLMSHTSYIDLQAGGHLPVYYKKLQDYLYELWYQDIDYEYAKNYYKSKADFGVGACSFVRNGRYCGRNLDWYYNNQAEFVIKTPARGSLYASVGTAGGMDKLVKILVESMTPDEAFKVLPFQMQDGINSEGVVASYNVVPSDYGTNTAMPQGTLEEEICAICLVRYILDHFATAEAAVTYIRDHMKVYFTNRLHDMGYELQVVVADQTKTYALNFVNNATEIVDISDTPYITNFHRYGVTLNGDGTVYTPETQTGDYNAVKTNGITPHGSGLERFNLIVWSYDGLVSKQAMRSLLNDLYYTKSYPTSEYPAVPAWYTEFVGIDGMTVDTPASEYLDIMGKVGLEYSRRSRETGKTWQTTHSVIYDIDTLTMYITAQEQDTEYTENIMPAIGNCYQDCDAMWYDGTTPIPGEVIASERGDETATDQIVVYKLSTPRTTVVETTGVELATKGTWTISSSGGADCDVQAIYLGV